MYQYNLLHCLPSSAELPDSDDTPVDSELQSRHRKRQAGLNALLKHQKTPACGGITEF